MPFDEVMHKFKHGMLHSGSKHGPLVKSRAQMLAIMMSEKRAAGKGKKEYQSKKKSIKTGPSSKVRTKHGIMEDY
jgi:hypothetical protein